MASVDQTDHLVPDLLTILRGFNFMGSGALRSIQRV